jgi:hypothetical protein
MAFGMVLYPNSIRAGVTLLGTETWDSMCTKGNFETERNRKVVYIPEIIFYGNNFETEK